MSQGIAFVSLIGKCSAQHLYYIHKTDEDTLDSQADAPIEMTLYRR